MDKMRQKIGDCVVRIGLDKRHIYGDQYKLAVIFSMSNGTKSDVYYYPLGEMVSEQEFIEIASTDISLIGNKGKPDGLKARHKLWVKFLDDYTNRVGELSSTTILTIDKIKIMLTGKSTITNFISMWDDVIANRRAGTSECYRIALNSFMKTFGLAGYNGKHRDEEKIGKLGFNIDANMLHEWVQDLTDKGLTKTTIGMYLRACRVVVNECCQLGYMTKDKNYPFGEKGDKVSVPRGKTRKHESLSVDKFGELYDIYVNKYYPETWSDDYKKDVHESLGLFLFMYLGNGMNLADVARLRYEDYYKRTKGKAIRFERTKTRERTDDNSEVIVPITAQLKRIMEDIAAPYKNGVRVFPQLLGKAKTEMQIMRRVQQENQNIRKRLRNLTESLGWPEAISPTWSRHSFATNLIQQGVPQHYVSEAMGHSTGGNVTLGYVGRFPLEKQVEYNSKLLPDASSMEKDELIDKLRAMDPDELKALLAKVKA